MPYKDVTPPAGGKIAITHGKLQVPDSPVIPFIRGDGTGPDIWAASVRVFGAWNGKLKRGSDLVALKDQNGVTLSKIEFKDLVGSMMSFGEKDFEFDEEA